MNQPRSLFCFAVKEEAAFVAPSPNHDILITGMGAANAIHKLVSHLDHANSKPDFIMSCGFAGGLNPNLTSSSVLFQLAPHSNPSLASSAERLTRLNAPIPR